MNILGLSGHYHDAAAALVQDGVIVAAAQEERFTRRKHDPSFPLQAIRSCLELGQVEPDGLHAVVWYEKPLTKFIRVLRTHFRIGPRGLRSFNQAIPQWMREKLWVSYEIEKGLRTLGWKMPENLWFTEHHEAHAAAAFFPSPFESAAILTFDGVGEWATSSIGLGTGNRVELQRQLTFPDSLGLLYSAFTYHCGFRVNSGEYKLMGLAPYGEPRFADKIREHLVHVRDDGSFTMDQRYFAYLAGQKMTSKRFDKLFEGPPRLPETPITRREMDLAASIQVVTEDIVLAMAQTAAEITGEKQAVLAGGVALNCVANARLQREGPFEQIWVQPAAGDAGSALGAALYGWHQIEDRPRHVDPSDSMAGAFLGPSWTNDQVRSWLDEQGHPHQVVDPADRAAHIAGLLADGAVVGVFQGRMEFGPRALGHRSILADPRGAATQSRLNLKTKFRESFRPFAPAVLAERADEWFALDGESPYMVLTAPVAEAHRIEPGPAPVDDLPAWAGQARSDIPAVTHVDHSARVQTVDEARNPAFHAILAGFEQRTGCPVLVNTSLNVRGEPIVGTPEDAYRCFLRTDIDVLVLEDCVLQRSEQRDLPVHDVPTVLVLD